MKPTHRFVGLRLWQKLTVIAVALGVPAVVLAVFYIGSMTYDGGFAKAELDGLDYIEPLNAMNEQVAAHRAMTAAAAGGDAAAKAYFRPKLAEAAARIDDVVKQADAADAKHGAKFGTTEKWKQVKADWLALKEQTAALPPAEFADKSGRLTTALLAVHTDVSEKSNLILDPILVTYYLQDNVTLRVLPLVEFAGEARAAGYGLAAKGEATAADRYRLSQVLGQVGAARAGFDGNVTVLKDRDPAAYEKLAAKHADAVAAADAFAALLQKQLVEADGKPAVRPEEVWEKGTAALDAYRSVNEADLPILRAMLGERYKAANLRVYVSAGLIAVALLLAGALVYGLSLSISRQTDAITRVFAQVKAGNPTARAAVLATDELGDIAASLNDALDATANLMQSQDEKDQIQASIMKLLEEVGGVAEGDLTKEAEVTADVTGAIADSFNYMIDQLRQIIGTVQRATHEVTGSAAGIFAATQELADGADQQAGKIAATSKAVGEMAVSARQVSENAARSAAVAQQALQNAKLGNGSVKDTIAGMGRIRDQVQETAKRIKRLGESTQEIGQIIQLIDDIADRTSILALNASIQAAMAGEAGRGFAVVAEEVERLADRSTDATRKIATLVKTIQSETTEAVTAMEKGIQEVVEGSRLATSAGQALDQIEDVSNTLAGLIGQITTAAGQQAKASDGVTRAMADISDITRATATGTKQAADSVQSLSEHAEELRASVAAFKLPPGMVELPVAANGHHKTGTNGHRRSGTHGYARRELAARN